MRRAGVAASALAAALVLGAGGCGGSAAPGPPAPAASVEPEPWRRWAPEEAAKACAGMKLERDREACVSGWSSSNAGRELLFADALMKQRTQSNDGYLLALKALGETDMSAEKAGVLLSVAGAALENQNPGALDAALDEVSAFASASGRRDLLSAAAELEAESLKRQGRYADAYAVYEAQLRADRTSVKAVAKAADVLRAANDLPRLDALCRELFAGGDPVQMRTQQALACLREKGALTDDDEDMALGALAAIPGLSADDVRALAPGVDWLKQEVDSCEAGKRPPLFGTFLDGSHGRGASVYLRLAEGKQPELRYCYLALAAGSCISAFGKTPPCPEPRSLDLYLQAMAKVDPRSVPRALDYLFEGKLNLYSKWSNGVGGDADPSARPESKPDLYRRWSNREKRKKDPSVGRTLFDMHIALAYVFKEHPDLARQRPHYTARYHVQRAQVLWGELHPEPASRPPFPKELLDPELRRYLRTP